MRGGRGCRFVKGISKQVQDRLAEASAVAEETVSNMRTVRSTFISPPSLLFAPASCARVPRSADVRLLCGVCAARSLMCEDTVAVCRLQASGFRVCALSGLYVARAWCEVCCQVRVDMRGRCGCGWRVSNMRTVRSLFISPRGVVCAARSVWMSVWMSSVCV